MRQSIQETFGYWKDFIIIDMPETDDAQIILGWPNLATAGCQMDVRKGWITFDTKEDVVSPSSSLWDALPLSPEINMEDVLNYEDLPDSDRISYEAPTKGMLRWSLLLLCHLTCPRLKSLYLTSLL